MTYSQFGQDDFVVDLFDSSEDGYFIDVGASHDGNDTLLLEEMGWGGICIEPIDASFVSLQDKRKCTCLNICVGDHEGTVEFMENTGYTEELSGVVDYYCDQHKDRISRENSSHGSTSKVIQKEIKTLNSVLEEQGAPDFIEFLKIDTEGGEEHVLKGIDFSKYSFGVISIESNYQQETDLVISFLKSKGYEPIAKVGIDIFFGETE